MNVGIIGVSGYTGLELIKCILANPRLNLTYIAATSSGKINEIFPQLSGVLDMDVQVANAKVASECCDLVFLALPHEKAMEFVPQILNFGAKVVDLSADYRLSCELYEKNYVLHKDPANLANAVYGLIEINRERIKSAQLVANPGCYPTCSLLALAPFAGLIDNDFGVMIDAKSGVSGAGKGLKESSHFVAVNENLNAYNPLAHRHQDEIKEQFERQNNSKTDVLFVPNLLAITRGMSASIFVKLRKISNADEILREFYKDEKFIRIRKNPVRIKDVVGTHFCDICVRQNGDKIWINSAIDNLLRGASSQAMANANLMLELDESLGLPLIAHGI